MSDSIPTKKNKAGLKMPRNPGGLDKLGIRYHGPVLTGLMGVNERLERDAVASQQTHAEIRRIAPGGAKYLPPVESIPPRQDPRLEPDPVLAAQRAELRRPEFYDPVLRHHAGLPPLPDRYEELRRREEDWRRRRKERIIP